MKNLFKVLTLVVLLSSGFFIFKSFNDRAKTQEPQGLVDLKDGSNTINKSQQKPDAGSSSDASYRGRKPKNDEINILADDDLYFGNKNSKVVMIEFSSLTCPHCKVFHDTIFPEIKARYIDTNKILYINRSFPTDGISFKFAAMVDCMKDNKSKILLRDLIFGSQETLFKKLTRADLKAKFDIKEKTREDEQYIETEVYKILDEEIEDFGLVANLDQKLLKSCIRDIDPNGRVAKSILNKSNAAYSGKYKINATPAFIINGKKYDGAQNTNYWLKILDAEIMASSPRVIRPGQAMDDIEHQADENNSLEAVTPEVRTAVEKFVESNYNSDEENKNSNIVISPNSLQEKDDKLSDKSDKNQSIEKSDSAVLVNQ